MQRWRRMAWLGVLVAGAGVVGLGVFLVRQGQPCGGGPAGLGSEKPGCDRPPGSIAISPGEDIARVVAAHGAGTTFWLVAGVHRGQSVRPPDGTSFIGEPGAVLDGEGTVIQAFHGAARDVTIRGLVIRGYANPDQFGAIHCSESDGERERLGDGWVVEGNEVADNVGVGVDVCHRMRLRGNRIHHNGQLGVSGSGDDVLVEGNEIDHHNTRGVDPLWDAGGAKFVLTNRLVVRGNHVHHNQGPGLWTDIGNLDSLIERNRVEYNDRGPGIFHEISFRATIRDNTVIGNGFGERTGWLWEAGILISTSRDTEVYGNTLVGNFNGVGVIQQDRHDPSGESAEVVDNVWVHDNEVRGSHGASGVVQDNDDPGVFDRVRFEGNRYVGAQEWEWRDQTLDWDGWRAAGNDDTGSHTP